LAGPVAQRSLGAKQILEPGSAVADGVHASRYETEQISSTPSVVMANSHRQRQPEFAVRIGKAFWQSAANRFLIGIAV
jgi:hypothetical protein